MLGGAAAVAGGAAGAAFQPGDAAAAGENRHRRSLLWLFGGRAPDRRPHHQCIRSQRQLVSLLFFTYLLFMFLAFARVNFRSVDFAITRRQMQIIERARLGLSSLQTVTCFPISPELSSAATILYIYKLIDDLPLLFLSVQWPNLQLSTEFANSPACTFLSWLGRKGLLVCSIYLAQVYVPGRHDGKQVRGEGECISLSAHTYNRIREESARSREEKRCHRLAFSKGVVERLFHARISIARATCFDCAPRGT